jgi:predicted nuclease with TOPRIM domain
MTSKFVCQDCGAELESAATSHTFDDCRQEWQRLRAEVERLRAEKEQLLSMLADSESAVRDRQGEIILLEAELRRLGYEL